ncbi:MAG TPA: response regulator transcription factor [Pseudomonadales bacterium]|nr:response regulator transcription factor [Pseudomonadales bacterium]
MSTRIIIADDHPLFRNALCLAVKQVVTDADILECDSIQALEGLLGQQVDVDLILLDLRMPGANGFSGLVLIRREFPAIPVVVISASDEPLIMQRAVEYGASGFIPKASDLTQIAAALQSVLTGEIWLPVNANQNASSEEHEFARRLKTLTPQQLRVFMMLTKGLLNKQIAGEVNVSEATVRTHMTAIFRKLGVRNRTQAVLAANYLNVDDKI